MTMMWSYGSPVLDPSIISVSAIHYSFPEKINGIAMNGNRPSALHIHTDISTDTLAYHTAHRKELPNPKLLPALRTALRRLRTSPGKMGAAMPFS
jgi:hypothetical protein